MTELRRYWKPRLVHWLEVASTNGTFMVSVYVIGGAYFLLARTWFLGVTFAFFAAVMFCVFFVIPPRRRNSPPIADFGAFWKNIEHPRPYVVIINNEKGWPSRAESYVKPIDGDW